MRRQLRQRVSLPLHQLNPFLSVHFEPFCETTLNSQQFYLQGSLYIGYYSYMIDINRIIDISIYDLVPHTAQREAIEYQRNYV